MQLVHWLVMHALYLHHSLRLPGSPWHQHDAFFLVALLRELSVSDLQIKHKTILDNAGEVKRWWFIVHAPESVLCDLDSPWESLNLQTGWKLEPCYKPGSQPLATMHSLCHNGNVSQNSTEDLPASNSPTTASATVDTNTSSESCLFLVN